MTKVAGVIQESELSGPEGRKLPSSSAFFDGVSLSPRVVVPCERFREGGPNQPEAWAGGASSDPFPPSFAANRAGKWTAA